jgi:hypothetical protein
MAENPQQKQRKRGAGRPFQPGASGNPKGKSRGTRSQITVLAEKLMADDADEIVKAVIAAAKGGDMTAARLILERISPVRKGRPVRLDLPLVQTAADVATAMAALTLAMAAGDVTPDEATTVAGVLEMRRKAIETVELEDRIAELEARK